MPEETVENKPEPADPWLRAALQRPAGPGEGDAEAAPVETPAVEPDEAVDEAEPAGPDGADAVPAEPAVRTDPSVVRRLALQALYVFGSEPEATRDTLLQALDEPFDDEDEPEGDEDHPDAAKEAAVDLAIAAWADHEAADAAVVAQVPAWPTRRQPPVDRAILRLAHHELTTQRAPFAVVIDEAVELAKAFGEDRTPGFVNAVLDALARGAAAKPAPAGDTGDVRRATGERPASGAAEARRGQRERFNQKKAEMIAKVGPKRSPEEIAAERERRAAAAAARREAEPLVEADDADAPADPWSAAARRRAD